MNRMGRLHIHLGGMENNRPSGIRAGSEVVVVIDGNQCEHEGVIFYMSANGAILTEGFEWKERKNYISQVYQLRNGKIVYTQPGGWIDDMDMEDGKKRPASVGSSISTHRRERRGEEHPSASNRERPTVEYQAEFPSERKRGSINEDPFDGNVRVEVKIEPGEEMRRIGSVLGDKRDGSESQGDRKVKGDRRGPAKAEPTVESTESNAPLWRKEGFQPDPVRRERIEG